MDGFSSLPEPIIHHIMSLLPTEDATRISILSKTLYSSWLSFPIMKLDFALFRRTCPILVGQTYTDLFLDHVVNSLQRRELTTTCLEKLSFDGYPGHYEFDSRITRMINFALENNVRELELLFKRSSTSTITCCLPQAIFSAESIKTLTLHGIQSASQDLILSCPRLEIFHLIECQGFKTVTLASNAKLKALSVEDWFQIRDIHFESAALRLESFSCLSYCTEPRSDCVPLKSNIGSSTTPNLKHLHLKSQSIPDRLIESKFSEFRYLETLNIEDCSASKKNKMVMIDHQYLKTLKLSRVDFDEDRSRCTNLEHLELFLGKDIVPAGRWIRNSFSEFRFLETLKLYGCSPSKKIKFHLEYLKTIYLDLKKVDRVEIQAPNMVSFSNISDSSTEIDIRSSSTNLKHLRLHGPYLPADINLSQFFSLETLELIDCSEMKEIKLHLEAVKSLSLQYWGELSKLEIEAPNLVSFTYSYDQTNDYIGYDYAPQVIINSKSKPDVKLHLSYYFGLKRCYKSLRNFIQQFAQHCQTFTLSCTTLHDHYGKVLIFPEELRKWLVPPAYNLKHLIVELETWRFEFLDKLIDSMRWLAPHLNTLSLILPSQVNSLKFLYKHRNVEDWQHDLKEVTIKNFGKYETLTLNLSNLYKEE